MTKLAQLQNEFVNAVYGAQNPQLLSKIKSGKAAKSKLLQIYHDNLYGALGNALRITYPQVYNFLGKQKFRQISQEFISENKSRSGNLDDYGEELSEFFAKKNENFLSDLSKLEWLKQKAYLASNQQPIDLVALQKLPSEKFFDLKFALSSSVFLFSSSYNLLAKSKQNQAQKKPIYFVIYRSDLEVRAEKIAKNEFNFLSGAQENMSLYAIYQKHKINVQGCLQKYLANGVLQNFAF